MLNGTEKNPALINDYKEYHTDTTVKFVVKMTEEKLAQAEAAGLHKVFKLQTSLTCNSMVSIHNGICNKLINAVRFPLQFFGFVLVWLKKHYCAGSSCKYLSIQSQNILFFFFHFWKKWGGFRTPVRWAVFNGNIGLKWKLTGVHNLLKLLTGLCLTISRPLLRQEVGRQAQHLQEMVLRWVYT